MKMFLLVHFFFVYNFFTFHVTIKEIMKRKSATTSILWMNWPFASLHRWKNSYIEGNFLGIGVNNTLESTSSMKFSNLYHLAAYLFMLRMNIRIWNRVRFVTDSDTTSAIHVNYVEDTHSMFIRSEYTFGPNSYTLLSPNPLDIMATLVSYSNLPKGFSSSQVRISFFSFALHILITLYV